MEELKNSLTSPPVKKETATEETRLDVVKKKSLGSKLKDEFIANDFETIKHDFWKNYVVPYVIDGVANLSKSLIDLIFYDSESVPFRRSQDKNNREKYASQNRSTIRTRTPVDDKPVARSTHEIIWRGDTARGKAEKVLYNLRKDLENDFYDAVTVKDLYSEAGLTSTDYTHSGLGWTDLSSAKVLRTASGYVLSLPEPKKLED